MAAEPTSKDDEIPLEDLVRDAPAGAKPSSASAQPASGPAAPEGASPSVDDLLAAEDPQFAASMNELKAQVAQDAGDVEIEGLDLDEAAAAQVGGWRGLIRRPAMLVRKAVNWGTQTASRVRTSAGTLAKDGLKQGTAKAKEGFKAALVSIKGVVAAFFALPLTSKLLVFAVVGLGILSVVTLKFVMRGRVLPNLQTQYLRSFADVADASFDYDAEEPMEDFTDPLFHPEHVVLVDKLVVNLKQPGDGTNPMGLFEFYIEASNAEGAVEIKDREVEIRDAISRTLEQMPYDELVTSAGKSKVKTILRKNLNQLLTKGRVRRVFFKNVVLKP